MNTTATAVVAGYGMHLLYTGLALRWRGLGPGPAVAGRRSRSRSTWDAVRKALAEQGISQRSLRGLAGAAAGLGGLAALVAHSFFGTATAAATAAVLSAPAPFSIWRRRRRRARDQARDAWPHLLDEVRVRSSSLGRSLPRALFDAGTHTPTELRPAFLAAERQWAATTDFEAALTTLKRAVADPVTDSICETLLVCHQLGGSDVDARLRALADDRRTDVRIRRDAESRQAGARFARLFVLIVPAGMALVGATVGTGTASYRTPAGEVGVCAAIGLVAGCWIWASRIMRLPEDQRVFSA